MPYIWIKALHVIAVISWMAGMLYLPRLFVYHTQAKPGSDLSETLKIMERRLLRYIMNPAMIVSFATGFAMLETNDALKAQLFMHIKMVSVLAMAGVHGMLARYRRAFAEDRNIHSGKFYRILNEAPTVLMIVIVIMIIVKPWQGHYLWLIPGL
ncbi:MAG: protoporphyrinogen oxidase HemJ [Alphaproteobacteria bacterium]|nr:protoporphyrinogen oxidase HemJ [Alphaproteobacteria bacterium]